MHMTILTSASGNISIAHPAPNTKADKRELTAALEAAQAKATATGDGTVTYHNAPVAHEDDHRDVHTTAEAAAIIRAWAA